MEGMSERLRKARKHAGLTLEQVADRLGYTARTVSRWENGQTKPPQEMIEAMADLYGVEPRYIHGYGRNLPLYLWELSLIQNYRSLSDKNRDLVDTVVRRLAGE